ncbi:hypothetical protein NQZ79_g7160 [Umbelopsis isabellina]|nr:hypothetical protein NQZ79_g7160 [Umbelopsis isabellina]
MPSDRVKLSGSLRQAKRSIPPPLHTIVQQEQQSLPPPQCTYSTRHAANFTHASRIPNVEVVTLEQIIDHLPLLVNGGMPTGLSQNAMIEDGDQMLADKRTAHNALERQRRENLNTKFQELAHTLPGLQTVRRPSKSMIVTKSLEFVSQAKLREMRFQHEINQLRKQYKVLQCENQSLKSRSDKAVNNASPTCSYPKESPPLTPESTPSGNTELDTDSSLYITSMQATFHSETMERQPPPPPPAQAMDEHQNEDLPFDVPVCSSQQLSDPAAFSNMYWPSYPNFAVPAGLINNDLCTFPEYNGKYQYQ